VLELFFNMSPEYNFHLKIDVQNAQEAVDLRDFILRIRDVKEITPLDRFRVEGGAENKDILTVIDLTTPIGQVVKEWREERGLKQIDVVRQAAGRPMSKGYYSQLEKGLIKNPSDAHLEQIAVVLGITKEDLRLHRLPPKISSTE